MSTSWETSHYSDNSNSPHSHRAWAFNCIHQVTPHVPQFLGPMKSASKYHLNQPFLQRSPCHPNTDTQTTSRRIKQATLPAPLTVLAMWAKIVVSYHMTTCTATTVYATAWTVQNQHIIKQ